MMFDDEIHEALSEIAGTAVDSGPVLDRIQGARTRRRRVHQALTVTGAGLAVGSLFTGITWLHLTAQEAGASRKVPPASTGSPSPTTVPPDPTVTATPRRTPSASSLVSPVSPVKVPLDLQRAFDGAGYGSADAQTLARLWRTNDPKIAEALAGQAILDGDAMPIRPGQAATSGSYDLGLEMIQHFIDDGFDYFDAQVLAKVWNTNDVYTAKALGGQLVHDGRAAELKALVGKQG